MYVCVCRWLLLLLLPPSTSHHSLFKVFLSVSSFWLSARVTPTYNGIQRYTVQGVLGADPSLIRAKQTARLRPGHRSKGISTAVEFFLLCAAWSLVCAETLSLSLARPCGVQATHQSTKIPSPAALFINSALGPPLFSRRPDSTCTAEKIGRFYRTCAGTKYIIGVDATIHLLRM